MQKGLVHLYFGDGKGKTTAATGLAVRAFGKGKRVLFAQFLKDYESGEIAVVERLGENFTVLKDAPVKKFIRNMTEEEQEQTAMALRKLFFDIEQKSKSGEYDLMILDEIVDAVSLNILSMPELEQLLRNKEEKLEIVMTGHEPDSRLFELCDYVTQMKKIKHPYDKGVYARDGIEK